MGHSALPRDLTRREGPSSSRRPRGSCRTNCTRQRGTPGPVGVHRPPPASLTQGPAVPAEVCPQSSLTRSYFSRKRSRTPLAALPRADTVSLGAGAPAPGPGVCAWRAAGLRAAPDELSSPRFLLISPTVGGGGSAGTHAVRVTLAVLGSCRNVWPHRGDSLIEERDAPPVLSSTEPNGPSCELAWEIPISVYCIRGVWPVAS